MLDALIEAKKCVSDVPIGCIIKKNGIIIASAHNLREENNDITAHAEILAIKEAQKRMNTSRLTDCEMYVTLEPCPMCAWAIIQSGIKTLYYGSYNTQYGAMGSVLDFSKLAHSNIKIFGGIEEEKCNKILEDFWSIIRKKR